MKRFTVLIPRRYNDGTDIMLDTIERALINTFSGYSLVKGITINGGWLDNGTLYRDEAYVCFVVCANWAIAELHTRTIGRILGQLEMYLEFNGTVKFINCKE